MSFSYYVLGFLGTSVPTKELAEAEFVPIQPPAQEVQACVLRSQRPVHFLRSLAKQISEITCKRQIGYLTTTIDQLKDEVLDNGFLTYLAPLMDYFIASDEPTIMKLRKSLIKKADQGYQKLLEVYLRCVVVEERDFVQVNPKSRGVVSETLYPVRQLRKLAERASEVTVDSKLREVTQHIAQLRDEQLDVQFVKLNSALMSELFFSGVETLEMLRRRLKSESAEFGQFFERLVEIYYTYDEKNRKIENVNVNRYLHVANQIGLLKSDAEQAAKFIVQLKQDIHLEANPVKKLEILVVIGRETKKLEEIEKKLRMLEAYLHIFTTFLERRAERIAEKERMEKWIVVGAAVSFLATSLLSCWLKIPYYLANDFMNGGTALDGFSLSSLAICPGFLAGGVARIIHQTICSHLIWKHPKSDSDGVCLPIEGCLGNLKSVSFQLTYGFDPLSSGLLGALLGWQSGTWGKLNLIREDEERAFRYSVKDGKIRLKKEDLHEIQARMLRALYQKQLNPVQCLNLLSMLGSATIKRRENLPEVSGFISPDDLKEVFLPVIRLCLIQIDESSFDCYRSQDEEEPQEHAQAMISVRTSFIPTAQHVLVSIDKDKAKEL